MKVAFIIPPQYYDLEPYALKGVVKSSVNRPPLGLLYVAATLREQLGIESHFIDCAVNGYGTHELQGELERLQPDIIGFSVLTYNLLDCIEAAKVARKVTPSAVICFGGWHPTLYPKETLQLDEVDIIVVGEGEYSFPDIVTSFMQDGRLRPERLQLIPGIGYSTEDGEMEITPARPPIRDLDKLPMPAYDLLDRSKYSNVMANTSQVINLMTSRGCPHKCVFCDMRQTPFRWRSAAGILHEIRYWVERGINEFYIQDDNFTISRRRTEEFCRMISENGLKINYKISARVDSLDEETFGYLKKSGCYRIHFGVESGSDEMLAYLQKGITTEQTRMAFTNARNIGIDRFAYVMIGLPYEQMWQIEETRKLIREIKPDYVHCSICTPMPQTLLYNKMLAEQILENDYWLEFARRPTPGFQPRYASQIFRPEELRAIQASIHQMFYFRPGFLFREALKTRSLRQLLNKARVAVNLLRNV